MYHAMQTVGGVDEYHWRIAFDNQILTHERVADLLNRQAEDLEVLRGYIKNIPRAIEDLMLDACDRLKIRPEVAKDADAVLSALGVEERLT